MGEQFDPRVALALVDVAKVLHLLPPEERERMISRALFVRSQSAAGRSTSEDAPQRRSVYARSLGL